METVETVSNGNFVGRIFNDNDTESPRAWDNLGTMIFRGAHSHLGDDNEVDFSECTQYSDDVKAIQKVYGRDCLMLTVYGYSHGGLTINTTGFSCPWDSGILGHVVVSREDVRNEWGMKRISPKKKQHILDILKGEVSTLDQYVTGEVYGYTIVNENDDKDILDSCWGFYGMDNVTEEVTNIVNGFVERQEEANK